MTATTTTVVVILPGYLFSLAPCAGIAAFVMARVLRARPLARVSLWFTGMALAAELLVTSVVHQWSWFGLSAACSVAFAFVVRTALPWLRSD